MKQINKDLTSIYIKYLKTKRNDYFTELYNALYQILRSKFRTNHFFTDINAIDDFDDIFQLTMIRLSNTNLFNPKKGNIVTYAYVMFKNILIDQTRKIKMIKIPIKNVYN